MLIPDYEPGDRHFVTKFSAICHISRKHAYKVIDNLNCKQFTNSDCNAALVLATQPAIAAVLAEAMAAEFATPAQKGAGAPPPSIPQANKDTVCTSPNGPTGCKSPTCPGKTGATYMPRGKEPETKPQHDRYGSTDIDKLSANPLKNAERGAAAIKEIMRKRSGFVDKAMYRPEVGWIRFEWGDAGNPQSKEKGVTHKGGHGLSHIEAKAGHNVNDLPPVLSQGEIFKHEEHDRLYVLHGDKYAVLRNLGKGHKVAVTEFTSTHDPKKIAFIKKQPRVANPGE